MQITWVFRGHHREHVPGRACVSPAVRPGCCTFLLYGAPRFRARLLGTPSDVILLWLTADGHARPSLVLVRMQRGRSSLGYEPYDARLCRLRQSPSEAMTLGDVTDHGAL